MSRYDATTYFNGRCTISVDGDAATGETYCMAYHLSHAEDGRTLTTMAIRYLDVFRADARRLIRRRDLIFGWTDGRSSQPTT